MLLGDEDFYGQVKITYRKPLTWKEINSVGWYCKNTEELQLFLKSKGFTTACTNIPYKKYIAGGVFYSIFGECSLPPTGRKEVEFIDNNL